jgi:hypothetical protein
VLVLLFSFCDGWIATAYESLYIGMACQGIASLNTLITHEVEIFFNVPNPIIIT